MICLGTAYSQARTDTFLQRILENNTHPIIKQVLPHAKNFHCQIIYTQINRDHRNVPSFKNYYFNYDPGLYFNPASTVKLPLAFLALEKLNSLQVKGVNKYTAIQYDSSYPGQTILYKDSTSATGFPSIAHFIKKAFLISDNDAYNRLYQFTGQQTIDRKLRDKGYKGSRIIRQFMGFTPEQNRRTNQIRFIKPDGSLLSRLPPAYNPDSFDFKKIIRLGKAHFNRNDSLINEPYDFTQHNILYLEHLQQLLQSVLFPSSVPARQRFLLSPDDYAFLYRYLSQYPSETPYPKYDTAHFYDSYVKFFFRNKDHQLPRHVRVFNKVGWAYGFLTDVSYVADFKNRVEFMLSVTIYVNSDGVLNDNKYDYDSIGYPFLYQVGRTIYGYELQRTRVHKPDLSALNIKYERRDPKDLRPPVREVDN